MSGNDHDVAVVGASIAGCAAATFLGRAGARVALLESHSDPRTYKRMCTHAIQGSAAPTIERLGLTEEIRRAGGRLSEPNVWSRYGWISPSRAYAKDLGPHSHSINVRRERLDPMLRELAAGTKGVDLMLGHTVTSLLRTGGGTVGGVVARDRDGAENPLRAKLVVGADGRGSTVAKLAGIRTRVKPNNRFVYFAYYAETPSPAGDSAQIWFLDPDMAYSFPTDEGLTLLACVVHKDRLGEFRADPEAAMAGVFEGLPDAPELDPSKRRSPLLGKLDIRNEARSPRGDGIALIGDAALASDPLWGVGCGWALQSAEWLADVVAPALDGGPALDRALASYARRHRRSLTPHDKVLAAYSTGRRFNPAEKLYFRAAARDDALAGRIALVGERWASPLTVLSPRALGRALRFGLSRRAQPMGLREARGVPEARPG